MAGFRPAATAARQRHPAPSLAPPPFSQQQQQREHQTPKDVPFASNRTVEGVPGSIGGDSAKGVRRIVSPANKSVVSSTDRANDDAKSQSNSRPLRPRSPLASTTNTLASSSSADSGPRASSASTSSNHFVASAHFSLKKTSTPRPRLSASRNPVTSACSTPGSSSRRPRAVVEVVVPMKRPSPTSRKGKERAIEEETPYVTAVKAEAEEEIDELDDDDDEPAPTTRSPTFHPDLAHNHDERIIKKPRTSLDSGYTEGEGEAAFGADKENDPLHSSSETPLEGFDQEIPESENGDGEPMGFVEPGVTMAPIEPNTARSGIGDSCISEDGEARNEAEVALVEGDLLAFTNRRIAILHGFVEIAQNGGGRSRDGLDENELRHTQSYVNERYDESRGRLEALGIAPTELQICKEKQVGCLEELCEVLHAPEGSFSSNGNDVGLIRHTLSYLESRIPVLETAAKSNPNRTAPRPAIPRITSLAGPLPAIHGSPSAVPGSRPVGYGSPSVSLNSAGVAATRSAHGPSAPKASSIGSASESQKSATITALQQRQQLQADRTPSGRLQPPHATPGTLASHPTASTRNINTPTLHTSDQVTLDASSSDRDPVRSPASKRPPPSAAPSGFRAAGVSSTRPPPTSTSRDPRRPPCQPQPAPVAPQASLASRSQPAGSAASNNSRGGRVELTPELDALMHDIDWEEDSEQDRQQQQQQQQQCQPRPQARSDPKPPPSNRNDVFSITIEDAPQRNPQPPPREAHRQLNSGTLVEQRRVPSAGLNQTSRTVSTASDVIITSEKSASAAGAGTASTSNTAAQQPVAKKVYPWTSDVNKALRQRFGLTKFRANQEAAINATLGGQDVFVLLPTGGGKSLCFQLPAVISSGTTKGVTIVVSPLLSLISDQTRSLIEKDIPVVFLNSTMPAADRKFAIECLRSDPPQTCLAYVTPEQIVNSGQFRGILAELHRKGQLARFVLDEAHCISSWGHDFRPDYKQMGSLKRDFPDIPLIALTATANSRVKTDVMANLVMKDPLVLTQSFNRANLRYHVKPKCKNFLKDMADFIKTNHRGECGIIYCSSKKQCEDTAAKLRSDFRIPAQHYHAGMDKNDRIRVQEQWQAGKVHVICATIAFGMGIDKADVRFVIHHSLSQSLEAYYQETGRAGRDGMNSVCVLYYSYGDTKLLMRLIDEGEGTPEQKEHNRANLRRVVQYCMNETDCRRSQVLGYFGEQFPKEQCHKTCDNCMTPKNVDYKNVSDLATDAVRLVSLIERDKGVTMLYAIDVFRGSKSQKIVSSGHDQLEHAGKGSNIDRGDCERLFQLLFSEQILGERYERNSLGFTNAYIVLGPRARTFLAGRIPLQMGFVGKDNKGKKAKPTKAAKPVNESYEHDEYEGEYVDELYDEETGIYEEDPDGDWDEWGRRVVHTKSGESHTRNPPAERSIGTSATSAPKSGRQDSSGLLAHFFEFRDTTATEQGISDPAKIISDSALQLIANHCPRTVSEFVAIKGLSPTDCDWWSDHGGKALCVSSAPSGATSTASTNSTIQARPASKTGAPKSKAVSTNRRTSAANNAAAAAEARSSVSKPKAAPRKAQAKSTASKTPNAPAAAKQLQLEGFRYKAPAKGSGPKGSGGGIMAMPLPKKR
ncbi:uncharacterized protein JCM15063_004817 [Sporobolomyces koalae]|uniref:uncharacterized protein n=1 Tax=Sporobolomyces koalae TaxID=500713 RepID=UPI003176EEA9